MIIKFIFTLVFATDIPRQARKIYLSPRHAISLRELAHKELTQTLRGKSQEVIILIQRFCDKLDAAACRW